MSLASKKQLMREKLEQDGTPQITHACISFISDNVQIVYGGEKI